MADVRRAPLDASPAGLTDDPLDSWKEIVVSLKRDVQHRAAVGEEGSLPAMTTRRCRLLVLTTLLAVALVRVAAINEPVLTKDQIRQFLLTADVVKSREIGLGVTNPKRLTLTDGHITHDAAFVTVDERKTVMEFKSGTQELNFVDSYHYTVAAYGLAELLGLDDMMPVTVEREWLGTRGSLSWWIDAKWDEGARLKLKLRPPDAEAWNKQMYRMRLFARLVSDTDRNLGNVLITEDWKLWMIDFTRAFRLGRQLKSPADLVRCDRRLLDRLRQFSAADVEEKTRPHLSRWEIEALMTRRDLIVAHVEKLIAAKGEAAVLY